MYKFRLVLLEFTLKVTSDSGTKTSWLGLENDCGFGLKNYFPQTISTDYWLSMGTGFPPPPSGQLSHSLCHICPPLSGTINPCWCCTSIHTCSEHTVVRQNLTLVHCGVWVCYSLWMLWTKIFIAFVIRSGMK